MPLAYNLKTRKREEMEVKSVKKLRNGSFMLMGVSKVHPEHKMAKICKKEEAEKYL